MDEPVYSRQIAPEDIRFTPAAQATLAQLMQQGDEGVAAIRIFVSGGGCGGMTYGMTYADAATDYDSVFEGEGFEVYVDTVALNYLRGCEVDYRNAGAESSFVFNNVFQTVGGSGTCGGCGGAGGGGF